MTVSSRHGSWFVALVWILLLPIARLGTVRLPTEVSATLLQLSPAFSHVRRINTIQIAQRSAPAKSALVGLFLTYLRCGGCECEARRCQGALLYCARGVQTRSICVIAKVSAGSYFSGVYLYAVGEFMSESHCKRMIWATHFYCNRFALVLRTTQQCRVPTAEPG